MPLVRFVNLARTGLFAMSSRQDLLYRAAMMFGVTKRHTEHTIAATSAQSRIVIAWSVLLPVVRCVAPVVCYVASVFRCVAVMLKVFRCVAVMLQVFRCVAPNVSGNVQM